jgi:predicted enzyme related to lactoylglutathione lyase
MKALEPGFFAIPTTDLAKAKVFYQVVMGWQFKDRDSNFSYIFANAGMIGSLELANKTFMPSKNGPLLFFRAEFMEKTLDKVAIGGGIVVEKVAIENGARGYTAKVLDPFDNAIAFWAPEE